MTKTKMNSEKNSTQWITIPDSNAQSTSPKKTAMPQDLVKNKILWGVGFAIFAALAFVFLVPGQFNQLFQGNLFDAQGISEQDMKINLLPQGKQVGFDSLESGSVNSNVESADSSNADGKSGNSAAQPSSEPVTIVVDPIQPTDCKEDLSCFAENLSTCSLSQAKARYVVAEQTFTADLNLLSADGDNCLVEARLTVYPDPTLSGVSTICRLVKGAYAADQVTSLLQDQSQFNVSCSGELNSRLTAYLANISVQAEEDAKQQLIDDLTQQLEALNQKIENQEVNLRGAAPEVGATSNVLLGQPSGQVNGATLNSPFKQNPYTVTSDPRQVLQQNLTQGFSRVQNNEVVVGNTISARQINGQLANNTVQASLSSVQGTPETGPTETLIISLILAYIGLSGFKYFSRLKSQ